jgi:hypothetical protein
MEPRKDVGNKGAEPHCLVCVIGPSGVGFGQKVACGGLGFGGGRQKCAVVMLQKLDPRRNIACMIVEVGDRQTQFGTDKRAGNFRHLS